MPTNWKPFQYVSNVNTHRSKHGNDSTLFRKFLLHLIKNQAASDITSLSGDCITTCAHPHIQSSLERLKIEKEDRRGCRSLYCSLAFINLPLTDGHLFSLAGKCTCFQTSFRNTHTNICLYMTMTAESLSHIYSRLVCVHLFIYISKLMMWFS